MSGALYLGGVMTSFHQIYRYSPFLETVSLSHSLTVGFAELILTSWIRISASNPKI